MNIKLSNELRKSVELANALSNRLGRSSIEPEHILYGIIKNKKDKSGEYLSNKININELLEIFGSIRGIGISNFFDTDYYFSPSAKKILMEANIISKERGKDYINADDFILAALKINDQTIERIFDEFEINKIELYSLLETNDDIKTSKTGEIGSYNRTPNLNKYGDDLTKKAIEGKIDPVIGRDEEIERITQILSRRRKNNSCLIGEPGVGKTAIVEGLAQKIAIGDVTKQLENKRIVGIDLTSMVAGSKYRGDFEEKIKNVIDEVKKEKDIILFIDEIHTIIGAGSSEGSMDTANILKPLLARGEIQLIGATTIKEYRKYIEKDSALERRFSPIMVDEPSEEDTIKIIHGIRDKYEAHHNIKISDEAIEDAVKLSVRYINDRFLPDKAIDLIDEASSKIRNKKIEKSPEILELEKELGLKQEEKQKMVDSQEFENAAKIRDEIKSIEEKIKNEMKVEKEYILNSEDIANVVSSWTKIPVSKLTEEENKKLKDLGENLHKRVIGQDEAVNVVAKAIKRNRIGLSDPNKPIGSFLFLGPTGVGKTELSKALVENLFGTEETLIRIDMSEYMEGHSVSKLVGSPPGYVGYDEPGQLTEKVRRQPYSVILFDEIEKAHPDVLNLMLQILDDGRLTDSQGRLINFKNTVIIMTSNIGATKIIKKNSLGFKTEIEDSKENIEIKSKVLEELKREFRPEFLNRIDEIVVFKKLTEVEELKILDIFLDKIKQRLKLKGIEFEIDQNAKEKILKEGMDVDYGARPLKRAIQNMVEDKIADGIIDGIIRDKVTITVDDDKIVTV